MKVTKRSAILAVNGALLLIVIIWTLPTVGLLISSIRTRNDIDHSGWWTVFPHVAPVQSATRPIPPGQSVDKPITIDGVTKSFDEWRKGVTMPDGSTLTWQGTIRVGNLVTTARQVTANTNFTLDNYQKAVAGKRLQGPNPAGTATTVAGQRMSGEVFNSLQ